MCPMPITVLLWALAFLGGAKGKGCTISSFEDLESPLCVCTSGDCELPGRFLDSLGDKPVKLITTSKDGLRFDVESFKAYSYAENDSDVIINIDQSQTMQDIIGFGGAFTDSAAINAMSLSDDVEDKLLRAYFSSDGLEYNVGRVPIAGTDFSTRPYSYDDVEGDVNLEHFSLTDEDLIYKIPIIKKAKEMASQPLKLFASPWSPPAWMKTNGKFNETGQLLREMWNTYSQYLVKFLQAYEAEGIPIWGMTPQNQPVFSEYLDTFDLSFNSCIWSDEEMREWLKSYLLPALQKSGYLKGLKIIIHDHTSRFAVRHVSRLLKDEEINGQVFGIGFHWYEDRMFGTEVLDTLHSWFPEKFIMYTESCEGFDDPPSSRVLLGSWQRAESYFYSITETLNHWSSSWVDWNLVLDMNGGPNWANNFVDSPIIVNSNKNEFYLQPMYYALGHFSKFFPRGSKRVGVKIKCKEDCIDATAVLRPDGNVSVNILNRGEKSLHVRMNTISRISYWFVSPSKSFQTVLFNPTWKNEL